MNNKQPTAVFLAKALPLTIALSVGAYYLTDRFSIGVDPQEKTCLEWRVFLIDRHNQEIGRGEIFAFRSGAMEPFFKNGTQIIKVVDGVPGDRVKVTKETVTVNDEVVGEGLALAPKLQRPPSRYVREEFVPTGKYWFMGRTIDSFDSRYWGYVSEDDIIGKAYPLW